MMALEHHLPDLTGADLPRLARAVGAMVAVATAPSAERVAVAGPQIDAGRKERVRRVIRKHLRTPTFRPSILCRLVGMSRSNLYRLFEDTGGVARYIQRERLLEAHAVLTDPASTQSISSIADDLCLQTPPASAVPSNVSSATARASCGRRHSPGWRHPRRCEALRHQQEQTSASLFAGFSGMTPLAHDRRSRGLG
jgi:AraC-like DNA-binding protein